MFTGIIEQKAEILINSSEAFSAHRLVLKASIEKPQIGESIAVNGVCLTLLPDFSQGLQFDISPETLQLTTLKELNVGDIVNLERSMLASTRMGGHYVSGHVETRAVLKAATRMEACLEILVGDFEHPAPNYLLNKGSIALDGVSLTINSVEDLGIKLMLVPHTLAHTNLGIKKIGQRLNIEFDYFARIVAHQLALSGQLKHEVLL